MGIVWRQTSLTKKESEIKRRPWIRIANPIFAERGVVKFKKTGKVVKWSDYWRTRETMDMTEIHEILRAFCKYQT